MEKIGFEGFFSPYGSKKTGTKIPYGFKELRWKSRTVCVGTGGERAVRGSPTKSKE